MNTVSVHILKPFFFDDPQGNIIGAIVPYHASGKPIINIPARLEKLPHPSHPYDIPQLYPGLLGDKDLPFWNRHQLALHPKATVFLCDDLLIAQALMGKIESKIADNFIVTTIYGGSHLTEYADWKALRWRNVIYVPKANREGYINTINIAGFCEKQNVKSFRVVTDPVLLYPLAEQSRDLAEDSNPLDRHLRDNGIILSQDNNEVFAHLEEQTLGINAFLNWSNKVGLIYDNDDLIIQTSGSGNARELLDKEFDNTSTIPTMACFADFQNISVIYGPSGAGKTQLSVSIATALSTGLSIWGLEAINPMKVLLIDAETTEAQLQSRIKRIYTAYCPDETTFGQNFQYRCLVNLDLDFSAYLDDIHFQNYLVKQLAEFKPQLLILDNLVNLYKTFNQQSWAGLRKKLMEWERQYNLAFLLFHHSTRNGKEVQGTENVARQSANEFRIISKEAIQNEAEKGQSLAIHSYAHRPGTLLGIYVKKCRTHHKLWYTEFGLYLGEGDSQWEKIDTTSDKIMATITAPDGECEKEDETAVSTNAQHKDMMGTLEDINTSLSERAKKLLDLVHKNGEMTIGDARRCLPGDSDTSIGNAIRELLTSQIDKKGSGKKTYYVIRGKIT